MKERITYLDIVRVLACAMIVLMHTPKPELGTPATVLGGISFLTAPGIVLFLMISGALLLPVRQDLRSFYSRRFGKLLPPLVFWTLVYLTVDLLDGTILSGELLKRIFSIPFSPQGSGILWFLYAIAGLYLTAPVISPFLEKATDRELGFLLGLWGITLLFPLLRPFLIIDESVFGAAYYFSGLAGSFVLGYYLHCRVRDIPGWLVGLLLTVPLTAAILVKVLHLEVDFYEVFWYRSIFTVMMASGWFLLARKMEDSGHIPETAARFVQALGPLCFGVYLMHFLLIRTFLWNLPLLVNHGGIFQICITFLIALPLSFGLVKLISLLPSGGRVTGCRKAQK